MHYARGKTLGGSSARNFMLYQRWVALFYNILDQSEYHYARPTIESLGKWAEVVDDSSYKFENVFPFYQLGLNYTPPDFSLYHNSTVRDDPAAFGPTSGPLQVSWDKTEDSFGSWAQKTLEECGLTGIDGFNSGKLLGSSFTTFTIDPTTAKRSSSESSFLQEALETTPLKVYNNTLAQRILFNDQKKATGVLVSTQNSSYTLSARKEVILSAGAFQSPQLLMVSGIGPASLLQTFEIPIVQDLPGVGQEMWDHPWFSSSFRVDVITNSLYLQSPVATAAAEEEWQTEAKGPLAVALPGIFGWEKLPNRSALSQDALSALSSFPDDWPELEYLPASAFVGNQSNYELIDPRDGHSYASMGVALVAPLSRGNISISSSSMTDPPLINPNWLTHPTDKELAVAGFRRSREFLATLSKDGVLLGEETYPGPSVQTDEQILEWIYSAVAPVWHASGTCKMGRPADRMAVIDSQARVYGVKGLRVVDASSFPFLPPGHPQSTLYAFALKIAAEVLHGSS